MPVPPSAYIVEDTGISANELQADGAPNRRFIFYGV